MKRILFLVAIFCTLTANAQNYFITFAGTGAANTVDSVKVENLRTGLSLTLKGDDILHLTGTVGIPSSEYDKLLKLKIYPNPMKDYSMIEISPSVAGDAIITVIDMTGRQLFRTQNYLDKSGQELRLSGLKDGFYLINVRGNNYQYSGKLLCTGQSEGTLSIEEVSNNIEAIDEKTSEAEKKGSWSLPYLDGDRLIYTGYSGNYGTLVTSIPTKDSTVVFNYIPCGDGEYYYITVQIGTQIWMANNLTTTKLNDGTPINIGPNVPMLTPAFVGSAGDATEYGKLYNWYAVNTGKLCPTGWHVPSSFVDWGNLAKYVGGDNLTKGGKLKETGTGHWIDPNYLATNEVGFTARPGGFNDGGNYYNLGYFGYWWASDPVPGGSYAEYVALSNTSGGFMNLGSQSRYNYFSVRCIKDN
jgi:uncharacterized protein (TIGR02145 family)